MKNNWITNILSCLTISIILNILIISPQITRASIFDIFKAPVEICMDIFIDYYDYSERRAVNQCKGADKNHVACMKRLIDTDMSPRRAFNKCKPN